MVFITIPVCPYCGRVHCICGSGPGRPPFLYRLVCTRA
jgi:hypothetical protein